MLTPKSPHDKASGDFAISNYIHLLDKIPGRSLKYTCPVCNGNNLSIAKDGLKYKCWDSCGTKEIAYKLRLLNGEFTEKTDDNDVTRSAKVVCIQHKKREETKDPIQVYTDDITETERADGDDSKMLKASDILPFYRKHLGNHLAYNLRTKEVELYGKPINLDSLRSWTQERYGMAVSNRELAIETVIYLARKNEYDPVLRYLETCYSNYNPDTDGEFDMDELCQILFGTHEPLYVQYLYRWLIGLIARVKSPGCKMDEALVLHGAQGCNKSSFFRAVAGDWFSDSMTDTSRESLLIMSRNWINEWAEFDRMTAKTYHGTIKDFLSHSDDMYRLPYGRDVQRVPRASVIVGSTNRDMILTDPTGNRRIWILPVTDGHIIPIDLVLEIREKLLGWAFCKFLDGESWHLPKEYWSLQAEDNKRYEVGDPWLPALSNWLDFQHDVQTGECLKWLEDNGYDHKYTKADEMRVGDILKKLGFTRKRVMRADKRIYVYVNPKFED